MFNCNQDMFINNVNIFTIFLYKTSAYNQPRSQDKSEPFLMLYGTINEYGLLCLFNFTLARGSLIFLGIWVSSQMVRIRINLLFGLKNHSHIHSCHFSSRLSFPTTLLKITARGLWNLFANSLGPQRCLPVTRDKLDWLEFPKLSGVAT